MTVHSIRYLVEESFESEVLGAARPVLVDFTAAWCSPCRALKPILQALASEERGRFDVVAIDADESPSLAVRCGVRGFPTLILFAGGREVARRVGLASKEQLRRMLAPHASGSLSGPTGT